MHELRFGVWLGHDDWRTTSGLHVVDHGQHSLMRPRISPGEIAAAWRHILLDLLPISPEWGPFLSWMTAVRIPNPS